MATVETSTKDTRSPFRLMLNARTISLVLVAFGIIVSGYLSYVKATAEPMACGSGFNCGRVQSSDYGYFMGVPIAYFGLMTYIIIGGLILFQDRVAFLRENGMVITFGIVLFAFLYSMYLVYLQGWVIGAWCQWCLMHEANMAALFGVTLWRLNRHFKQMSD